MKKLIIFLSCLLTASLCAMDLNDPVEISPEAVALTDTLANPLLQAYYKNDIAEMEKVLASGVDINAAVASEGSILALAIEEGKYDIAQWCIQKRAKITPSGWLDAVSKGNITFLKFLVKNCKVDVNMQNKKGDTALMQATRFGKADLSIQDAHGWTALICAAVYRRLDIVKLLVEVGKANVHIKDKDGYTALMLAAITGQSDIIKYLIEVGKADIHMECDFGQTALILAVRLGHFDVVKVLVNAGARDSERALKDAQSLEYKEIAAYLAQHLEKESKIKAAQLPIKSKL